MINRLFFQKLIVAFAVAFAGSFIPFLTGWFQSPNYQFDKAIWVAALFGAVGAGFRAILALGPVNLVPSDATHTIVGPK